MKGRKRILAVVPARGGSKGIIRKNLSVINGLSLIAHAGSIIRKLEKIDRAIISSDDPEIISEAQKHGLLSPFVRPPQLSDDVAKSIDVWRHAWLRCEEVYEESYDYSLLIEPTSPLRKTEDIEEVLHELVINDRQAVVTVSEVPGHFKPEKLLNFDAVSGLGYYIGITGKKYHQRQLAPKYYHRNGVCYGVSKKQLFEKDDLIEGAFPVIIDRPIVNIDEPNEIQLAALYLSMERGKNNDY
jgi:CMP-N,N'-diacetyllegionaminic acid synthase